MSKNINVKIHPNGDIEFIDTPELAELKLEGEVESRRASHVEPKSRILRWVFHRLRNRYGEEGAVAAFTRCWWCCWRVNLTPSGGPIYGRFWNRAEAIESEIEWLTTNSFGANQSTR